MMVSKSRSNHLLCFIYLVILCIATYSKESVADIVNFDNYFQRHSNKITVKLSSDTKTSFKANSLSFDKTANIITATGNIEINQTNLTIKADKAYLKPDGHFIIIEGNVYLKMSNKEMFAKRAKLDLGSNSISVQNMKIIFVDDSTLAARKFSRKNYLNQGWGVIYSACVYNKNCIPFWSLSASKITYNEQKKIIRVFNSFLRIKSMPVLWIPYTSYYDPAAKRKPGILSPDFGQYSDLGYYISVPLYLPINDHQNILIRTSYFTDYIPFKDKSDIISKNSKVLLEGLYRGFFPQVSVNIDSYITPLEDFNGAIFTNLQWNINDKLRLLLYFNDTTSLKYLSLYRITNVNSNSDVFLWQNINLEGFLSNTDYLRIRLETSKNNNTLVQSYDNPIILPQITYHHYGNTTKFGKVDVNLQYNNLVSTNIFNSDLDPHTNQRNSFDLNKLYSEINYKFSKPIMFGLLTTKANLQNTSYYVTSLDNKSTNHFNTYLAGSVSLMLEYPIVQNFEHLNSIINPIIQVNQSNILFKDLEDAPIIEQNILDINVFNLFENNKYSGQDFYETGTRLNYGLQWDLIGHNGFNGQMLIGQSQNLNSRNKSNYLISLSIHPVKYLKIDYMASLNPDKNKLSQNNVSAYLGSGMIGAYLSYRSITNLDTNVFSSPSLEEVQASTYVQVTAGWYVAASGTFNLNNIYSSYFKHLSHLQNMKALIMWQNSCFKMIFDISRDFYYGNLEKFSGNSYKFTFVLKNIGGTSRKQGKFLGIPGWIL